MNEKLITAVGKQFRKYPKIKKMLIRALDFFFEYKMIFVGSITRNPAYLKHIFNSRVIAKPGTLSFEGGVFNPGTLVVDENSILLLAKSQIVPWFKARGRSRKFFMAGSPVTFLLENKSFKIKEACVIKNIIGFPQNKEWAIEDMRLFKWKGKKMINHSLVHREEKAGFLNQTSVASAVSILDDKDKKFTFYAIPKLDFALQNIEKNWVYKEAGDRLLLFYSLNPYSVLVLEDAEQFKFKSVINQQYDWKLKNPGHFQTMVSFSTNPIDYDEQHWLVIIHQIDHKISGRCYYHWAVLIDKETLLPVKITSKPIFSGMGARGRTPGIRYISSILKQEDEILFFAGEGDVYVTVTKKKITEIESMLVGLF